MRRYASDEEDDLLDDEPKPYRFYEQQVARRVFHFYLSKPIGEPEQFIDMIYKIQTATPDDVVYIHMNTPGGNLVTGIQLINALRATSAHVICSVESEAHSLGTLVFLSADEFIVHDNVMMMFHNYSGITFGKGNEQKAYLEAAIQQFNDLARTLYIPFLTEDEFDRILRGEDLYFHSDEIRERLNKMVEALEEKRQEEEVEVIEAASEQLQKAQKAIKGNSSKGKKSKTDPIKPTIE